MERAEHRVATHLAVAQVAAHMRAVRIEDVTLAILAQIGDQPGAESVDRVRLAVREIGGESQAMPSAREAVFDRLGLDSMC